MIMLFFIVTMTVSDNDDVEEEIEEEEEKFKDNNKSIDYDIPSLMTTMMLMMTMTQHGTIKKFNARLNKQILMKYDILYISWIFY